MTPERLEQIRRVIGDEPLPDWASKIFDRELLAEVDRLRAAVSTMHRGLTLGLAMKREPSPNPGAVEAIEFVLKTGRELGLWD
jgi:hypothetical protein